MADTKSVHHYGASFLSPALSLPPTICDKIERRETSVQPSRDDLLRRLSTEPLADRLSN